MNKNLLQPKDFRIEIEEKRILRLIGYRKAKEVDESVRRLILGERARLDKLLQTLSLFKVVDYDKTNKHPIFKDAEKVALCICTIGPMLEEEASRLMKKNELLRAMVLDAFGSEAVEEVAIQSDRFLSEKAREMDLWPSKRFSPGYGRWDIKEQRFIFGVLPAHEIGVNLHPDSCMMIPRKSISFRINFYKDPSLSTKFKRGNYDQNRKTQT